MLAVPIYCGLNFEEKMYIFQPKMFIIWTRFFFVLDKFLIVEYRWPPVIRAIIKLFDDISFSFKLRILT